MTRTIAEITADIDANLEPSRKRMREADRDMRGLRPAELDWATSDELRRHNELLLELMAMPGRSREEAAARVAAKRAARMDAMKIAAVVDRMPVHGRSPDEGAELCRKMLKADYVIGADGAVRGGRT